MKRVVQSIPGYFIAILKKVYIYHKGANQNYSYQRPLSVVLAIGFILTLIPGVPYIGSQKASAGGSVAFVSASSTFTNNGTTLVINKPTGTSTNDILIAVVTTIGTNPTITTPSSPSCTWTSINEASQSTNITIEAFWCRAGGSEPSTYTFTSSTTTQISGGIALYRGALSSGSPIGNQSSDGSGTSTSMSAPAVTTSAANVKAIAVYGSAQDAGSSHTPPTTANVMKERFDVASSRNGVGNIDATTSLDDIAVPTSGTSFGANVATAALADQYAAFQFELKNDSVIHMFVFWDSTSTPPTGWTVIDDYDGMFPRGESAANFGLTGGNSNHTHTAAVGVNAEATSGMLPGGGAQTAVAGLTHTHNATATVTNSSPATNNNLPVYETIRLIRYDTGVPNVIPANAVTLFDNSPGIPSGWTNLAGSGADPYYQKTIRIDPAAGAGGAGSTGNTGGSDTHTHTVTWSSLTAASTAQDSNRNNTLPSTNPGASDSAHTHTAPTASTTPSVSSLPPYVEPLLAKANVDTATLSIGVTGMFDGDPGGGWVLRSESSGGAEAVVYNQQFFRPNSTFNSTSQGAASHAHANLTSGASGAPSSKQTTLNTQVGAASNGTHTHTLTSSFDTVNNLPPYFNIVVAEKVNFILNNYQWYHDNDALQPTNKWGNPDIGEFTAMVAMPIATAEPPDLNDEIRIRFQILVNGNTLAANVVRYKLQYNKSIANSCTTTTGTWTDVAENSDPDTTKPWKFASSSVTGETTLSSSIFTSPSNVMGRYVKSNTGSNNNPAVGTVGQTMEYDYHIVHQAADGGTQYAFRLVESTGTLLGQYTYCPTLITRPRVENQLRHGNFFLGGQSGGVGGDTSPIEQGFSWVD